MIQCEHLIDLIVYVGQPIEIGSTPAGVRRIIPIVGGEVRGERVSGRILPGGADFQLLRNDGVAELHARYVIEASDGVRIVVENSGLRHGPTEAMARIRRGEPVDPEAIYFRTTPRFETTDGTYAWLMKHIFVAEGIRKPDCVELAVFQIL
jgi:Protein of unknown function (DUF3237)